MAIGEAERVALYWSDRDLQELQADLQQEREGQVRTMDLMRPAPKTLDGGCLLYQLPWGPAVTGPFPSPLNLSGPLLGVAPFGTPSESVANFA
jgi:hypothetical protein